MLTLHDIPGDHIDQVPVAAVAAATATGYVGIWSAPFKCKVTAVRFVSSVAATGDNTNSKNLNVLLDDGSPAEIGNYDLVTGVNLVVGTPVALDVPAAGTALAANQNLIFEIEKVGTGVLVGPGTFLVTYVGG